MADVVASGVRSAVLHDLFDLTLLFGGLGLLLYWAVRSMAPLQRWGSHGTVFTGMFGVPDLVVAGGVVAYYYLSTTRLGVIAEAQGGVEALPEEQVVVLLAGTLTWQVLFTGLLLFYLGFLRRVELDEQFGLRQVAWRALWRKAVGWTALGAFPVVVVAGLAGGWLMERAGFEQTPQFQVQLLVGYESVLLRGLMVASAVVGAPVMEEVVFRGFLYPVVKRYSDRFFAAAFTSAVFALAHQDLGTVLPLFGLGLLFAVAFERTGSLWLPVLMHAMFNGVQVMVLLILGERLDDGVAGWSVGMWGNWGW